MHQQYLINASALVQGHVATKESRPKSAGFSAQIISILLKKGDLRCSPAVGGFHLMRKRRSINEKMRSVMQDCNYNVCDEYRDDWDLSGTIEDLINDFKAATVLSNSEYRPGYYLGSEFHSLRPITEGLLDY
ncbi:hypothetical protein ACFOD0_00285 [Shewanella intestini]|uniref:Uncharacterized protein n=1 Tax=Shewanella intestini TaxID=2017544 RepID=A0ABS5HZK4_9GAMM|nr:MULTISPECIES: hypothetical protein [Shewanella]MBR9727008.1 hypothetical protein [Shewanella intestini]MRG35809.1 hypothetical protein [Shewanella sp. XMDDZSB0408]